jgi:hypothetical protein
MKSISSTGVEKAECRAGEMQSTPIGTPTTLAGVVRKPAALGPFVEGANGICAQRAEAHGGNVKDRKRVGMATVIAADRDAKIMAIRLSGVDRVTDPLEALAINVLMGAERALVESALRALIRYRAFRPVERCTVGFALEKVLPYFGPDLLEHETDMRKNRVIAPDAVARLQEVPNTDCGQRRGQYEQCNKYDV